MTLLMLLTGCVTLDWAVFNGVPCAQVGPETCEDKPYWDQICVPCAQDYPWDRSYDWMDGMLTDGQTVRPIDPASVQRLPAPTLDGAGELDVYWIPPHGDDPSMAARTVIYAHGNYASIDHYLPRIRFLHEAGFGVVAWDYRGYGKSTPDTTPTPTQFHEDALVVRDLLTLELAVPDDRVVLYGYSLGAIPTVETGLRRDACAMLLESPFTGLDAVIRGNTRTSFPSVFLYDGTYENVEKIADYDGPLFVMSGDLDTNFPPDDVARLVDAAGGPTSWWRQPDVRHGVSDGGVPEAGLDAYIAQMRDFLDTHCPIPPE